MEVMKAFLALLLAAALSIPAVAGPSASARRTSKDQKKSSRKKAAEYALLFGSVFDEAGLSARGVEIRVREKDGRKKWTVRTDARGEFAVQLPPGARTYVVEVVSPRLAAEPKEVAFTGDERQDIALRVSKTAVK